MKIKDLLKDIEYKVIQGDEDREITKIAYSSKRVSDGSLFVCIKGFKTDGHNYMNEAVANGAIALLIEENINNYPKNITIISVNNTREILPRISSVFYEEPSKHLNLIGITGTNGKTSVSVFISSVLQSLSRKVGVIGTINNCINDKVLKLEKTTATTPESTDIQFLLSQMRKENANDVVMEVSSMALELHRVDYCDFHIGIFTNFSQDHLDDHKTMENYKNAKLKLFNKCKHAVINADDIVSNDIIKMSDAKILTYSINNKADLMAYDVMNTIDGVSFKIILNGEERRINANIPGIFSVYNALATIGTCYILGLPLDDIVAGVSQIQGVRGRFELIKSQKGYSVIVDYAHSPDALENILSTVKGFCKGQVITVFGCGGDRDRTKRPVMGEVAGKLSDFCIITSDNPRTENPDEIMKDIECGIRETNCNYEKIADRKYAIHHAIDRAKKGDIIIIAGKGHETYQIIGNTTIHFDDVEVVNEYILR